jgi:chromosome segregation ATPase
MNSSIGVLNNNAVTVAQNSAKAIEDVMAEASKIAENSSTAIKDVLAEAIEIANVVKGYKDEVAALLEDIRKSAEEKQNLEETLHSVKAFLSTSKLATLELSNEIADLLVLANIPNSKKEELYSRHRAAVDAISTAEKTEEIKDDGQEA